VLAGLDGGGRAFNVGNNHVPVGRDRVEEVVLGEEIAEGNAIDGEVGVEEVGVDRHKIYGAELPGEFK